MEPQHVTGKRTAERREPCHAQFELPPEFVVYETIHVGKFQIPYFDPNLYRTKTVTHALLNARVRDLQATKSLLLLMTLRALGGHYRWCEG